MLVVEVLLLEARVLILMAEVDQVVVAMEDQEILLLNRLVEDHSVKYVTSMGFLFRSVIIDSTLISSQLRLTHKLQHLIIIHSTKAIKPI